MTSPPRSRPVAAHRPARAPLRVVLGALVLAVAACGPASPEPAAPPSSNAPPPALPAPSAAAEVPAAGGACLPLVHGCGCAYDCARAVGATPGDPPHMIVEVASTGARIEADVSSWCDGQAFLCPGGRPGYYDRTPCGGECIPTRAFDGCHLENGRCVP